MGKRKSNMGTICKEIFKCIKGLILYNVNIFRKIDKHSDKFKPLTGCIPSPKDNRDYKISGRTPSTLPNKVDLRNKFSPIKNQNPFNSCVGMALTSIVEYYKNIQTSELRFSDGWDLSDMQLWYDARKMRGLENKNSGCYIRDALKISLSSGISVEKAWPYKYTNVSKEPNTIARMFQGINRIKKYYACLDEEEIKITLNRGHPVIFGMRIYQDFIDYGNQRDNSIYNYNGTMQNYYGSHAMVIVGYDNDRQCYIVRNSWGQRFGDKGYNYISYNTFNRLTHDVYGVD